MIQTIAKLVAGLRARGIAVSTAEGIDAAHALGTVGVESRDTLRIALRAALAKGHSEQGVFDEIFDALFVPPARAGRTGRGSDPAGAGGGGTGGSAASAAVPGRSARREQEPVKPSRGSRAPETPPSAAQRAPSQTSASPPQALRPARASGERSRGVERPAGPPSPTSRPRAVSGSLEAAQLRTGRLRRIVRTRPMEKTLHSGKHRPAGAFPASDVSRALAARELAAPMSEDDERRLSERIPRLLAELRMRRSRRWKSARSGRVWPRAAVRENLRFGGVPFVLPVRTRRRRRSRIVLLVDVSWSVARSAGLFLAVALKLVEKRRDVRVILFVDRPVDATDRLRGWIRARPHVETGAPERGSAGGSGARHPVAQVPLRPPASVRVRRLRAPVPAGGSRRGAQPGGAIRPAAGAHAFLEVLGGIPNLALDAPSDYGRAFWALSERRPVRCRDTVLVVLGDGRTNRFDPQEWAFRELTESCRRVLWLVSEPRARWGTGDSALPSYLAHCDVAVEAADLDGLVAGLAALQGEL